jgi:hypothetical protein
MVAYQAESDLLALLRPHYVRAEQEGRTLLHELFASAGDIRVCESELHITSAPLSSPHRTHAAEARSSTKPRRRSPARACVCALQSVRHRVSGLPSPALRSSAALRSSDVSDVIFRLPHHPAKRLAELFPWNWKPQPAKLAA